MAYDSIPRSMMQQGLARSRGLAPTAAHVAATMSQTPTPPPPPPSPHDFIKSAYDSKGGKMTAADWQSTASAAVKSHGYDVKDLKQTHSGLLKEGQIKRSRVRFTGYQWNHEHGMGAFQ